MILHNFNKSIESKIKQEEKRLDSKQLLRLRKQKKKEEEYKKMINDQMLNNYKSRLQSFMAEMIEHPVKVNNYKPPTTDVLNKDANLSELRRKGFYFNNFRNGEKERINHNLNNDLLLFRNIEEDDLNHGKNIKMNKSSSLPTLIQPNMRYTARNSVERILDEVNKDNFHIINEKEKDKFLKKLSNNGVNKKKKVSFIYQNKNQRSLNKSISEENNPLDLKNNRLEEKVQITNASQKLKNNNDKSILKPIKLDNLGSRNTMNKSIIVTSTSVEKNSKKDFNENIYKEISKLFKNSTKKTYFQGINSISLIKPKEAKMIIKKKINKNIYKDYYQSSCDEEDEEEERKYDYRKNKIIYNENKIDYKRQSINHASTVIKPKVSDYLTPRRNVILSPNLKNKLIIDDTYDDLNKIKDNKPPFKDFDEDFTNTKFDKLYRLAYKDKIDMNNNRNVLTGKQNYKAFIDKIRKAAERNYRKGKLCKLIKDPLRFFEDFYFNTLSKGHSEKSIINELNLQVSSKQMKLAADKVLKMCGLTNTNKNAFDYHRSGDGKLMFTNGMNLNAFSKAYNLN